MLKHSNNRVLIVVGDQWTDPSSTVIDSGVSIGRGYEEFEHIAALLKIWGIPFDVLRLDQQNISLSYFVDGEGCPLYGCIIWDADSTSLPPPHTRPYGRSDPSIMPYIPLSEDFVNHDYSSLVKAVKEKGIGLIGIGRHIREKTVEDLLGIRYAGTSVKKGEIAVVKDHFITRGMTGKSLKPKIVSRRKPQKPDGESADIKAEDAEVLATQNGKPVVTVREPTQSSRTVWIGGYSPNIFSSYIEMRFIFRRALVWCIGFGLYKNYFNTVILLIDDFGIVRQKATKEELARAGLGRKTDDERELTYSMWKYPALTNDEIEECYIKPLKESNAVLNHYVVSAIYRPNCGYMVSPWNLKENYDEMRVNDMASTLEGLKKGLELGVFEIQDHGWSHHGVGPWRRLGDDPWPTSERSGLPGINLTFQYRMSRKAIKNYFGFTPLSTFLGRGRDLEHNAGRAARKVGFRLVGDTYAGCDFVINLTGVTPHPFIRYTSSKIDTPILPRMQPRTETITRLEDEGISIIGEQFYLGTTVPLEIHFHDRDVAYDHDFLKKLLRTLGDEVNYIGLNEYAAYMNSQVSGFLNPDARLEITLDYTEPSCRHFEDNTSGWTLHLSDETICGFQAKRKLTLRIDGEIRKEIAELTETIGIEIPQGLTTHTIQLG